MERLRLNLGAAGYTEIDGGFLSPDAMAERKAETSAAVAGAARALALPAGLAPGRPRPDGGVALRLVNAASNPEVDAFINNVEGQRARRIRGQRARAAAQPSVAPVPLLLAFDCPCKRRQCYDGIIEFEKSKSLPAGFHFERVRDKMQIGSFITREERLALYSTIRNELLPPVGGHGVCQSAIVKISGHSRDWYYMKNDSQKRKRNQKMLIKRRPDATCAD